MGFYVDESDRSYKSGLAAEDIPHGCLVVADDAGVRLATATDDNFDGVADNPQNEAWIAYDHDEEVDYTYSATENDYHPNGQDRVVYGGDEDGAKIKTLVADVTSLTEADNPHTVTVGIGATAGKVVVQTDETDFLEIGDVYKDSVESVDEPIRVEVRK